jgi:nonribosomal peptide synthetase DhbF
VHPVEGIGWRYASLAGQLRPDHPIYALQARGLARSEPLPTSIAEMAADYAEQIRTVQPTGPYHLLGWSLGGVIAHAVATHLQALGQDVGLLAILDGYPRFGGAAPDDGNAEPVARAGMEERLERMIGEVAALASERADVDPGLLESIRATLLNTLRLGAEYTPARFHGDMLLFVALQGRSSAIPAERAAEHWQPYVEGLVETRDLACEHREMIEAGPIAEISRVLAERLP